MLELKIQLSPEGWDEEKQEFVEPVTVVLQFEHSLVSISKWESKWHKPFLTKQDKTFEETVDYIKCMTLTPNVDPEIYTKLNSEHFKAINDYIGNPMTATTVPDDKSGKTNRETPTSELIYYWMVASTIPFECQYWLIISLDPLFFGVAFLKLQTRISMRRRFKCQY